MKGTVDYNFSRLIALLQSFLYGEKDWFGLTTQIMKKIQNISIETVNYMLPEHHIARFPLLKRDGSKLLVYRNNGIEQTIFSYIPDFIPDNALLVFNNTQVIQARLFFYKETGTVIEIFCLEPIFPKEYDLSFAQKKSCIWLCMIGNARRWKNYPLVCHLSSTTILTAKKFKSTPNGYAIQFEWNNSYMTFADILEQYGHLPLPPYLKREEKRQDKKTYQTVYACTNGSVAAPTAGLHFTSDTLSCLRRKHVLMEQLTLHIGAGTFKPIKSKTIADHEMHTEQFFVKKKTIECLLEKHGRVFAVGTTSVRTLESLYFIGVLLGTNPNMKAKDLLISQWMPYGTPNCTLSPTQALKNILHYMEKEKIDILCGHTQILIVPGYQFRMINGMITNFHQPCSTLLLLVSAFTQGHWREIYDYALQHDFRFLSYGDSSLLFLPDGEKHGFRNENPWSKGNDYTEIFDYRSV